jgi:hypothetical protein
MSYILSTVTKIILEPSPEAGYPIIYIELEFAAIKGISHFPAFDSPFHEHPSRKYIVRIYKIPFAN